MTDLTRWSTLRQSCSLKFVYQTAPLKLGRSQKSSVSKNMTSIFVVFTLSRPVILSRQSNRIPLLSLSCLLSVIFLRIKSTLNHFHLHRGRRDSVLLCRFFFGRVEGDWGCIKESGLRLLCSLSHCTFRVGWLKNNFSLSLFSC